MQSDVEKCMESANGVAKEFKNCIWTEKNVKLKGLGIPDELKQETAGCRNQQQ